MAQPSFWLITALWMLVIIVWTEQASVLTIKQNDDADDQLWLADEAFYDFVNIHDTLQRDQGVSQTADLCPPVPAKLPQGSCHAQKCTSDRECATRADGGQKCCYNGCIYACLPELAPPPFIDWIREPRRRLRSGLSWLVNGPDTANAEQICSTTPIEKDADPLICPQGYYCNIFDEGEPAKGISNLGTCARTTDNEEDVVEKDDDDSDESVDNNSEDSDDADQTESNLESPPPDAEEDTLTVHTITHEHACDLDGKLLLEGHKVVLDRKQCICKEKRLFCTRHDQVV